jgi:hypothetical protein
MNIGARLRRRWYLVILAAIIGIAVAGASLVKISSKGIHQTRTVYHVAAGELLIDTDPSTLTNVTRSAAGLAGRASLIAQYSTGSAVIDQIAKKMGIDAKALTVQAQSTSATKTGGSATKNVAVGRGAYSVLLRASSKGQTIGVSAQAHSKKKAKALVAATISAVRRALTRLQSSQPYNKVSTTTTATSTTTTTTTPATTGKAGKTGSASQAQKRAAAAQKRKQAAAALQAQKAQKVQLSKLVLRQLGSITSAKVVSTPKKSKAVEYGLGAFIVLLLLVLLLDNVISGARRSVPVNAAARHTDD